ncbi:MAG: hypothetical protein AAFY48_09845 [Bacteroidota bacterium]
MTFIFLGDPAGALTNALARIVSIKICGAHFDSPIGKDFHWLPKQGEGMIAPANALFIQKKKANILQC